MTSPNLQKLPFWLHSAIEFLPSVVFLIDPSSQFQLPKDGSKITPTLGAEAMIRQYGVLLFVSVLISTIFALREVDKTSRQVAAALCLYHVAPIVRAVYRLRAGQTGWMPNDMGGPWVHLIVHVHFVFAFGNLALGLDNGNRTQNKIKTSTKRK